VYAGGPRHLTHEATTAVQESRLLRTDRSGWQGHPTGEKEQPRGEESGNRVTLRSGKTSGSFMPNPLMP